MMQQIELWDNNTDANNDNEQSCSFAANSKRMYGSNDPREIAVDADADEDEEDSVISSTGSKNHNYPGRIDLLAPPPPKRLCRRSTKIYPASGGDHDHDDETNMTRKLITMAKKNNNNNNSNRIDSIGFENRNFDRAANTITITDREFDLGFPLWSGCSIGGDTDGTPWPEWSPPNPIA